MKRNNRAPTRSRSTCHHRRRYVRPIRDPNTPQGNEPLLKSNSQVRTKIVRVREGRCGDPTKFLLCLRGIGGNTWSVDRTPSRRTYYKANIGRRTGQIRRRWDVIDVQAGSLKIRRIEAGTGNNRRHGQPPELDSKNIALSKTIRKVLLRKNRREHRVPHVSNIYTVLQGQHPVPPSNVVHDVIP